MSSRLPGPSARFVIMRGLAARCHLNAIVSFAGNSNINDNSNHNNNNSNHCHCYYYS